MECKFRINVQELVEKTLSLLISEFFHYKLIFCNPVPETGNRVSVTNLAHTKCLEDLLVHIQLRLLEAWNHIIAEMYRDEVKQNIVLLNVMLVIFNFFLILI